MQNCVNAWKQPIVVVAIKRKRAGWIRAWQDIVPLKDNLVKQLKPGNFPRKRPKRN